MTDAVTEPMNLEEMQLKTVGLGRKGASKSERENSLGNCSPFPMVKNLIHSLTMPKMNVGCSLHGLNVSMSPPRPSSDPYLPPRISDPSTCIPSSKHASM